MNSSKIAGDTIEISAKAFYNIDNAQPGKSVNIAPIIGATLAAMTNPVNSVLSETAQLANDLGAPSTAGNPAGLSNLPEKNDDENLVKPKSGINFVLFNSCLDVVDENTGYLPVDDNINAIQILATDLMIMKEAGFLEIFVNNDAQTPVYYDNLRVVMRGGNVMEVNAYYPFGMIIPNLSTWLTYPNEENYYKYNGKELQKDLNLNWLDYGARMYDPVVARWQGTDPMAEWFYSWSPYAYCLNNPIRYIDPDGREIVDATGKVIYTHQGGWVSNAPADAMRIGNAMMATRAGTEQWNNAVNSKTKIQFVISSETIVNGNTYKLGNMAPGRATLDAQENVVLPNATITIYEGTINKFMNDPQNSRNTVAEAYQMNTTTNDQRIAAVAGHEIEHVSQTNLNQNYQNKTQGTKYDLEAAPRAVEFKILEQTGLQNLKPITPIDIDLEKLRTR